MQPTCVFDGGVVDDATSRVIVDGDSDGSVEANQRAVAPDDGSAWSPLKHHVVAVVTCKVELVDRLDCNNTRITTAPTQQGDFRNGGTSGWTGGNRPSE